MLALILTAFAKGRSALLAGFDFGRFRLGFVAAFVLYNWTEAAFKALHPVWFVFYIIAIDYPRPQPKPVAPAADDGNDEDLVSWAGSNLSTKPRTPPENEPPLYQI